MIAALIITACIAAAGLALARGIFFGYARPPLRDAILSAKEQAIVAACADALFPRGGPIPLSGTEAGLVGYMDQNLRRLPRQQRALVRLLFAFIEHGPWIFGPRLARFTRLTPDERIAALSDMARSRIYFRRIAFLSMRTMLSMGYLANGRVAESIGMVARLSPFELPARLAGGGSPS